MRVDGLREVRQLSLHIKCGNLPVRDWFAAMFLLTSTKRAISAKELQRQLGRKRYLPVRDDFSLLFLAYGIG